ncbi:uncharacterized protein LOC143196663 isoform X2 [Rhynchophorus ferrugineus]|uniref:uncharacterized protein LOC143196663 isoform X2 n=1 Tax=Rhynchophorus ferrugineus TaxID=354439 RepID=UPI003FCD695C
MWSLRNERWETCRKHGNIFDTGTTSTGSTDWTQMARFTQFFSSLGVWRTSRTMWRSLGEVEAISGDKVRQNGSIFGNIQLDGLVELRTKHFVRNM